MSIRTALKLGIFVLAAGVLVACDSAEERAEEHYQSAIELLESGDVSRGLLELRNVLSLDELHAEARELYARTAREIGNIPESYSQYLRLSEQSPRNAEARLALSEMAILSQNWDEAERHGVQLASLEDQSVEAEIVALSLRFREAVLADDGPAIDALMTQAEALTDRAADSEILSLILIEGYARQGQTSAALDVADRAIAANPSSKRFYGMKTGLLARLQDIDGLESHLRAMVAAFPDDNDAQSALVRVLAQTGKLDSAEDFIREQLAATESVEDKAARHVGLITFVRQTKDDAAALEEVEVAIEAYPDNQLFTALKSGILFDRGDREEAIGLMEGAIAAETDSVVVNRFKITLARMLATSGNDVGARQLVEEVLAQDATQVEALKMSAEWLIESDQTDQAISALTLALDQSPEDADAMTLLARAHQRNGNRPYDSVQAAHQKLLPHHFPGIGTRDDAAA